MSDTTPITEADWPKVGDPDPYPYDGSPQCAAILQEGGDWHWFCIRPDGHPMPHVASGMTTVRAVWTTA